MTDFGIREVVEENIVGPKRNSGDFGFTACQVLMMRESIAEAEDEERRNDE